MSAQPTPARTRKPRPTSQRSAKPALVRVGMLGVGIMGRAMAANLVQAGFEVTGYDPDRQAMKRLKAAGGAARASAADLARDAQVIISVAKASPMPQAKRFCGAPTYSGVCVLTIQRAMTKVGA